MEGVLTIYFSESLTIPPKIENINNTVLDIKILPFSTDQLKHLNFTWNVNDYSNAKIVIQLNFIQPLYVSCSGRLNLDKIQVTALLPEYFTS